MASGPPGKPPWQDRSYYGVDPMNADGYGLDDARNLRNYPENRIQEAHVEQELADPPPASGRRRRIRDRGRLRSAVSDEGKDTGKDDDPAVAATGMTEDQAEARDGADGELGLNGANEDETLLQIATHQSLEAFFQEGDRAGSEGGEQQADQRGDKAGGVSEAAEASFMEQLPTGIGAVASNRQPMPHQQGRPRTASPVARKATNYPKRMTGQQQCSRCEKSPANRPCMINHLYRIHGVNRQKLGRKRPLGKSKADGSSHEPDSGNDSDAGESRSVDPGVRGLQEPTAADLSAVNNCPPATRTPHGPPPAQTNPPRIQAPTYAPSRGRRRYIDYRHGTEPIPADILQLRDRIEALPPFYYQRFPRRSSLSGTIGLEHFCNRDNTIQRKSALGHWVGDLRLFDMEMWAWLTNPGTSDIDPQSIAMARNTMANEQQSDRGGTQQHQSNDQRGPVRLQLRSDGPLMQNQSMHSLTYNSRGQPPASYTNNFQIPGFGPAQHHLTATAPSRVVGHGTQGPNIQQPVTSDEWRETTHAASASRVPLDYNQPRPEWAPSLVQSRPPGQRTFLEFLQLQLGAGAQVADYYQRATARPALPAPMRQVTDDDSRAPSRRYTHEEELAAQALVDLVEGSPVVHPHQQTDAAGHEGMAATFSTTMQQGNGASRMRTTSEAAEDEVLQSGARAAGRGKRKRQI